MKTKFIIIGLLIAMLFNCKDKKVPCEVSHLDFPFQDTIIDSNSSTKILFLKNGNFWIESREDTTVFEMKGNFDFEMDEHAEWYTLGPSYGPVGTCATYHDVYGTISITQSSDNSCIGEDLEFEFHLAHIEWNISIWGNCYNFDGSGSGDLPYW